MYVCIYHTHTYNFEGAGELLKHRTWGARYYSHHISSPTALRPACCKKPKLDHMQNPYGGTQDYMKREAPRLHEEPVPSCCSFHCSCFTSLTATSCNTLSWTFSNFLPTETVRDNEMMIVVSSHKKKKKKRRWKTYFLQGICQFLEHSERPRFWKMGLVRGQLNRGREPTENFWKYQGAEETKLGVQDCHAANIQN